MSGPDYDGLARDPSRHDLNRDDVGRWHNLAFTVSTVQAMPPRDTFAGHGIDVPARRLKSACIRGVGSKLNDAALGRFLKPRLEPSPYDLRDVFDNLWNPEVVVGAPSYLEMVIPRQDRVRPV